MYAGPREQQVSSQEKPTAAWSSFIEIIDQDKPTSPDVVAIFINAEPIAEIPAEEEPADEGAVALEPPARKAKRNLPKEAKDYLLKWFENHEDHPYSSANVKSILMKDTGFTKEQVCI